MRSEPVLKNSIDVRASLRASFKDGVFASMMTGVTDHYVIPFSLVLGATVQQVGWVSGVPNLLGSISQLFAVPAVYKVGGRLKLLILAVSGQATVLLLIAALAWFVVPHRVEAYLLLLMFFSMAGAIAGPAWGSLMSDYIPMSKRGRYFGWRSRMLGAVNVASMIGAGLLLYWSEDFSRRWGFFIIFLTAALARFVSAGYISRMSDVPQKRDPANEFTFIMFLARFRESNFVKFVAFVSTLTFAAYLAAPFFAVFMLRDLQFSYFTYMLLQATATAAGHLALPLWGRNADLVGNVRVLRLAGFLVSVVPFFWLVSHNVFFLMVVQAISGFAWSGVTFCATNFIYDAVMPQKRVRCIGYFNVISGTSLFLGSSLGGFLASRLPPLLDHSLLALFALSGLCRLFFYFLLSRRFEEVRPSREVSIQELFFSIVGIRPLADASRE